jgi:hypothetical protein
MPPLTAAATTLKDESVRAIAALASPGLPLTAESLAALRSASMIYVAELDRFLVSRFDAESNGGRSVVTIGAGDVGLVHIIRGFVSLGKSR